MPRRHPILRGLLVLSAFGFVVIVALAAFSYLRSEGIALLEKNAVAVVSVEGVIEDSRDTVRALDRLAKNDAVRAVVLRVNSPGGGVAPSQEIYGAVLRVREKKPIVGSLGGVAASGGYYIASACDVIVANPGTLTGSIGVIMQTGNVSELLKKLGIQGVIVKAGRFKDIGSPLREMSEEEKRLLDGLLENVHSQFIAAVSRGRNLPVEQVRPLADGRIYSGEQAREVKLVDQLGGLRDAVQIAAERAGISGEPSWIEIEKRQPPWWWRRLTGLMENGPESFGSLQFLFSGPWGTSG
ncbi:MAG TPA: signal peptide peptidase SppA [Candidatus Binatia bacterium]|nr:signal peptide peptidase SppA [Candidatus Binatia bacterium]